MELTIKGKSSLDHKVLALGSFFVFSFLLSCNPKIEFAVGFSLPLLMVSFCCSYRYIAVYYISLFLSCLFYNQNQIVLIMAMSIGALFQIASIIKLSIIKSMSFIIMIIALFYLWIFNYSVAVLVIGSVLVLFHCMLYKEIIPIFMHDTMDVYIDKRWTVLLMLMLLCVTSLFYVNEVYMFLMLRYIVLLCIYYLGVQITMPCLLYLCIILIMQNIQLQNEVLAILLPSFIYFIYEPKNKIQFASIYLLSHIVLPFFITYDYFYHGFVIVFSALLFVTTPNLKSSKSVLNKSFKDQTLKNKLIHKSNSFSSLFKQLTLLFKDTNSVVNTDEYIQSMFDQVCMHCSSNQTCYKKGPNRLVKLITKGINEDLSLNDKHHIESYCLKPDSYLSNLFEFRLNHAVLLKQSSYNKHLKEDLFNELSILSNVFDNFSDSIQYTKEEDVLLTDFLNGYHFNIQFIRKYNTSMNCFRIELGFIGGSTKIVYDELVPILEGYLNQSLQVVSIKESVPYLGYTAVILKHDIPFVVDYGVSQIAYDDVCCGDSFTHFKNNSMLYYGISDGMGQGTLAGKESKLTLDILSNLICNGISLEDTLDSINSLLRIKNKSDMFTTLDLCTIDEHRSVAKFIKYGANQSYIIQNNKIDKIEESGLPVGIVNEIQLNVTSITIKMNDIYILCSDGVEDQFIDVIKEEYRYFKNLSAQSIATDLMNKVKGYCLKDDATIIVLKINELV